MELNWLTVFVGMRTDDGYTTDLLFFYRQGC